MNPGFYQQNPNFKYVGGLPNGMDLRGEESSPPFHHTITDPVKSILALQELQNEVGALLEFRDVVMETFPQLRGKMAAAGGSKSRWEPGIRVRKKLRDESSQPRSRSNSRSKTALSSSAVQDSGFCTESKKTTDQEAEDELWCLLELIHTKGTRLRLEVESLRDKYHKKSRSLSDIPGEASSNSDLNSRIQTLLQEKDLLLDRVTEMEAENLAHLAQTNQLLEKVGALTAHKRDLEERLKEAVMTKEELSLRIQDLHSQVVKTPSHYGFTPVKEMTDQMRGMAFQTPPSKRPLTTPEIKSCPAYMRPKPKLGTLDGIVTTPHLKTLRAKGVTPDKEKTAAILQETNILELQRHLLTATYEVQVAQHNYDKSEKSRVSLSIQLDKYKEENDDLKFQLEEKSIELEGTKARVRLLEKVQGKVGDAGGLVDDTSSTESAHESPKKQRPSKIPLKSYSAPKPPPTKPPHPRPPPPRKASETSFTSTGSSHSMRTAPLKKSPSPLSLSRERVSSEPDSKVRTKFNFFPSFWPRKTTGGQT